MCPPWAEGYPSVRTLGDYLRTATARVLTSHFANMLSSPPLSDDHTNTLVESVHGTSIQDVDKKNFDIGFALEHDGDAEELSLSINNVAQNGETKAWKWSVSGPSETSSAEHVVKTLIAEQVSS
jgi:mediator of RNA polymerase II transcription subunit 17